MQVTLALLFSLNAFATEVIWLDTPTDADRRLVAAQAGATTELTLIDLRSAATRWSEADDLALANLDTVLQEVRSYETKLDGELVIMRDLKRPISKITLLRDKADREALYKALAYQGFAVNRFFGDTLASDEAAAPYRYDLSAHTVERPWVHAAALAPDREVTPYDIAEAPQRVAFKQVISYVNEEIPAAITPGELPEGGALLVDGVAATVGPTGNIKVPPGRHFAHLLLDGQIIARWELELTAGEEAQLEVPLTDELWRSFLTGALDTTEVPDPVRPLIAALGGEVWLAQSTEALPQVVSIRSAEIAPVEIIPPPSEESPEEAAALTLQVGALGGWLSSGDYYLQAPGSTPRSRATVNSFTLGAYAGVDLRLGALRIQPATDLLYTPGENHAALSGTTGWRLRPIPHVGVGLAQIQALAGYMFPLHPALGARAALPLGKLEVRATGWYGLGTTRSRDVGGDWQGEPVFTAYSSLGVRL